MITVPVAAQQTIIIGDDKPSADSGGPERSDTTGVIINNDVLDSLGSPGAYAPYTTPKQAGPAQAGQSALVAPGTAYRLPGSGQLVISRPSTLLFPPPTFPRSRLVVPPPAGRTARTTTMPDTGQGQSQLLVPKPAPPRVAKPKPAPAIAKAVPREPVTEAPAATEAPTATVESPPEAPPVAPVAEPTPPPIAPVTPKTEPIAPAAPAAVAALPAEPPPAAEPPSAPSLTSELQSAPPPAETSPETSPESEPATAPLPSAPAATAEPTPEPEAKPAPAPSRSAALPPARGPIGNMRLVFSDGSAELTATATGQLDGIAKELLSNADARVQLLAFAKASKEGSSRARRLSLSRALAVRAYLIEKGIRSTRMDVRALGSGFEDGPPDRVDILPQNSAQ